MTNLHPHWQSTDDSDERHVPVRIATSKKTPEKIAVTTHGVSQRKPILASRRPAAFVGVLLCIIAGAATFQGLNNFTGQVNSSSITVHIREKGADPVTITVQPGYTITWTNDDTIPHVLSSDTLPTVDGKPFTTSPIFPGSSTHILIPASASPGAYPYISKTSDTVSGQIIVKNAAAPEPAATSIPASPVTTTPTPSSVPDFVPFAETTPTADISLPTDSNSVAETPIVSASTLPVNTHTIGSGEVPLPDRQTGRNTPAITQHVPHSAAETGPEVWITVLMAIGALLVVTRKTFRSL